ncbi:extracellular solute-binding protein [Roseovarius sp. SCSIO 43702]|uniref:extracellular solute-binding protein n=1 Tax=Roseovarius sp. SCSIO 43702 TaxID=2823043 RepID=UPI001C72C0D9|nr:extracellular solute-binding protein [Roseovarius sp. SCSIO 43702]QYX56398.1 extracellular solute-binding protein [Roseovarius sp. SCSIO 43702]
MKDCRGHSAPLRGLGATFRRLGCAAVAAFALSQAAVAQDDIIESHGYSYFGNLSYPADFEHFDYVNPDAPKGGEISLALSGTFDSMNPYSRLGRASALSTVMYESLLGQVLAGSGSLPADHYDEYYGLLAERIEYPEDKSWVIFYMRPEARFSNGTPVTAHDVAFSHNLLLDQGLKSYADAVRKRIPKVEVIDDHTVKFYFTEGISRRSLIDQVGTVPVWSKDWYEETGARLDEPRMEVSPGSGPYILEEVDPPRRVTFRRNPDYWGWDLPINRGRHNFDTIRLEYFADSTGAFEAFKAGEVTFRTENDPKQWASFYDFPAIEKGWVKREEIPDGFPPNMTGIVFNLGSDTLKDRKVRQAVALGFNFEWTNKSLLYGLYEQQDSFSTGTPLAASGLPEGDELDFLKSLGDIVPEEMFTTEPWTPHESDPDRLVSRKNLRKAMKLLDEAGWPVGAGGVRRNEAGEPLRLDFLFSANASASSRATAENFVSNLQKMGIDARFESVDAAQYTKRERDRDYDLIFDGYPALLGTGTGLAQRFGSEAAEYSLFNPAGLASPMVDRIIEESLMTESEAEEHMTIRALDRALRYEFFVLPDGYAPDHWVAYWDIYDHPDPVPPFALGALDFWWYDAEKAERLRAAGAPVR